jgi:uncharacterized protein YbjT (DUF2867 family)
MKILVIGANGKIGRILAPGLLAAGFTPVAMVRNPAQEPHFESQGIETVVADLELSIDHAFQGCDAAIFTAGSGGKTGADKTMVIDLYGALRSIEAAKKAGMKRFDMVSALKAHDPLSGPERIHHYLIAKHVADDYVMRSGLDYFVLRPGGLTDEPGGGGVTLVEACPDRTGSISRSDVAAVLVEAVKRGLTGKVLELVSGNTPVEDAIAGWV